MDDRMRRLAIRCSILRMTYEPIINTQADLESAWRHLMEPLGFGGESLWLMFVRPDGVPLPQLSEVEGCESPPSPDEAAGFVDFLAHFATSDEPGLRLAALRTRPGTVGPTERDRLWAAVVYDACRAANLPAEVVHVATDRDIYPLPLDALGDTERARELGKWPHRPPAA